MQIAEHWLENCLCLVTVPDVTGQTQANAASMITAADLTVGTISHDYSDTVPAGSVISQNPTGGTSAACGSAVDLVISEVPTDIRLQLTSYLQLLRMEM